MTDAQTNQETEEAHVTLTTKSLVVQQQSSSVSSDLVSKFINPTPDTGIDSILNPNVQSDTPVNVSVPITTVTPSSDTTIPQTPIPIIQPQQQTHDSTTTTTIPTTTLPEIPNFASLFGFEQRVSSLDTKLFELKQTNQFAEALSLILSIVDNYLVSKMKEAVDVVVQLKSDKIREEAQAENQDFLNSLDSDMKRIIKEQDNKFFKKAIQTRPTELEDPSHQEFNTGDDDVTPPRETQDECVWHPSNSPTPDREWHHTKTVTDQTPQPWITQLAQAVGTQSSFDEFLATPIDFSAFIMNLLKIENLNQDVLTGPTYDLIKGSCKSVA
ncbi:hypothetical protein Tco_1532607 [Tanacetum coccineum]